MPTLIVSLALLETLGINLTDVEELNDAAKRQLEASLVSRGFNILAAIRVRRLRDEDSFLLIQ